MPEKKTVMVMLATGLLTTILSASARAAQVNDWFGITGEVRTRYEGLFNFDFDNSLPDDDNTVLLRTRLGADFKPVDLVRFYIQIQDSRVFGEEESTASDMEGVDLHQGYGEIIKPLSLPVTIRAGRQELAYGKQRLIGDFNWSNIGRTFDGARITTEISEKAKVDLFWAQIAEAKGGLDDDSQIAGIYGVLTKKGEQNKVKLLEPYVIYRGDNTGSKYPGGDNLNEYTLGGRIEFPIRGFLVEGEFAYQLGEWGSEDIKAMATHGQITHSFDTNSKPVIGFEYNFATGDEDPEDSDHGTFDNLFPTNHDKYGYMDLVGLRNINDYRIITGCNPAEGLKIGVDYHFFSLDESTDALYRASGLVLRAGSPGRSMDVGQELDLLLTYAANTYLSVLGGYSHFFAGKFFTDTGSNDDADFAYVQLVFALN